MLLLINLTLVRLLLFLLRLLYNQRRFLRLHFLFLLIRLLLPLIIIIIVFLFLLKRNISTPQMRLRLLILLVLFMNHLLMLNFKLFLLHIRIRTGRGCHLWHVEDLEHGIEIQMLHIQTFQNDLSNNKVNILLLQFYFFEKL